MYKFFVNLMDPSLPKKYNFAKVHKASFANYFKDCCGTTFLTTSNLTR